MKKCSTSLLENCKFAPTRHLTAIVNNWSPYYIRRTRDVLEDRWQSRASWDGLAENVVQMAPYNPGMPADVVAAAEAVRTGIARGQVHPFAGPVRNRSGEEVVASGAVLPDSDIHSMNWLVEGVSGDLPH